MQKNKHILISFLNSILNLKGENSIKNVEFEEKHLDVSMVVSEKLSILDLHVSTESNLDINILNFDYLKGENYIKYYGLFEKETKDPLTDLLEIIFIELPKFSRFKKKENTIGSNKEYNEKL